MQRVGNCCWMSWICRRRRSVSERRYNDRPMFHVGVDTEYKSDLAEVESVLELMAESPVVRAFDEKKKEVLRNLLVDMRNQLTEEISEVAEEEANHVSTGEEVKERNTVLDRNVCQHTSNLIKRVLSLVMYGRNKVDSYVCYKRDRNMSSANSLRDRTLGFGV